MKKNYFFIILLFLSSLYSFGQCGAGEDNTSPTFTCPSPVTVNLNGTCQVAIPDLVTGIIDEADNCTTPTVTQSPTAGTLVASSDGTTHDVTISVNDGNGNIVTCIVVVTGNDATLPTFTLSPASLTIACSASSLPTATNGPATANDNCATPTIGFSDVVVNGTGNNKTITRTWTATDANSNVSSYVQTITVTDTQAPTFTLSPASLTIACSASSLPTATNGPATANDNCATPTIGFSDVVVNGTGNNKTITRTWTATDANSNVSSYVQTITVTDTQAPTFTLSPASLTIACSASSLPAATNGPATANDNCATPTIGFSDVVVNGTGNNKTITRTWTATDANSNVSSYVQTITVTDTQAPTFTLSPASLTIACSASSLPAATNGPATANDNCATPSIGFYDVVVNGTGNNKTITRTWTATDANSNVSSYVQTITVTDTQAPTFTLSPASLTIACSASSLPAATNGPATANDNCATPTIGFSDVVVNGTGNNKTITRTWTATDANSNVSSYVQTITVTDTQAPTISCPAPATANTNSDGTGNCTTTVLLGTPTASDNCTTAGNLIITAKVGGVIINPSTYLFGTGNTTVVWTATDQNGNISLPCNQTITVTDNEKPTASNPAPIVASGSAPASDITVVINEVDNCTANPVVAWVSDTPSGTCPVTVTRIYKVTDNAGNSINVTQTITVNDATKPIAKCIGDNVLVVTLDGITGKATILASQINNGSTDNCGPITLSLDKYTFGCNDIGVQNVTLTITDNQGNTATCTTKIRVDAPTINSGTLTGYIIQTETIADASNVIEITACPVDSNGNTIQQDVALKLNINPALASSINRWEYSTNGGVTWSTIIGTTNTTTTYTVVDVQVTTLVRAVINVGDCLGFSPIAIISIIPPDIPPTIINGTEFNTICLGDSVLVVVESEYGVNLAFNEGGLFNQANLNNLGWQVDGEAEMSAGGDNGQSTYWKETNGPKNYNGRCYDTADNTKFAVVAGIPQYVNQTNNVHIITPLSTLETPIFNTLGLTTAHLEFDQAYFLEAGAWAKIEISIDGGANYDVILDPGAAFDYTGPSNTGFATNTPGFTGSCKTSLGTKLDKHVSIDLQKYIGLTGLRIKFTYSGTTNSVWAIDNVEIPDNPIDEVIEWTDDSGVIVATGSTVSIKPVTPGIQNYGATSLINNCRSADIAGTEFIKIEATLSYAGNNIVPIVGECGEDTVTLSAYDNTKTAQYNYDKGVWNNNYKVPNIAPVSRDYPATGEIGTWSITVAPPACTGDIPTFSDINDPNATFTGKPGTYTLTWTVKGCASTVQVTINSCSQIDFDGLNDYITFKDNYDKTGPFSIEMWIKAGDLTGTQSLISKRDANNLASGYDLRLNGGFVEFHWGLTNFITSDAIDATTWHHIAVTFNGSTYKLYMDGVEKASTNGSAPTANLMDCMLGAMDQADNPPNKPVNYYYGWIDELRIWNKALNIEHIRQMMNQEIKLDDGDNVMGEIIPIKIYGPDATQNGTDNAPLLWSDLDGYYRMAVNCGYLSPYKGSLNGRLRNIYSDQEQTAPLPYLSANNGLWNNNTTWMQPVVWYTPNNTVFGTKIDWNIVQTAHNISSGNKDITVLGLISTAGKLTIANPSQTLDEKNAGQGLWITHYLKLNGSIDLVGESQLVQKRYGTYNPTDQLFITTQFSESILDAASLGYIERDQQGKKNSFNYNYWSSPVSTIQGLSNNTLHSIAGILRDGTDSSSPGIIDFGDGAFFADAGISSPIKISNRWINSYNSKITDGADWANYSQWKNIKSTDNLKVGEGFTMKGTGGVAALAVTQNHVFVGKPNSGTISLTLNEEYSYLVGNPYPSALDANEFILDNLAGRRAGKNIFNGALYFWDHFGQSDNHILAEYEGGYATYTLMGGVAGINDSPLTLNDGATGSKIDTPKRYIPVGQGFFIDGYLDPAVSGTTSTVDGGDIIFKNSQRVFQRETSASSIFMKTAETKSTKTQETTDTRLKIRLGFDSPVGAHRQLLVGVDSNTTLLFDIGYDAPIFDMNDNDMYWELSNSQFVIQAIPDFNVGQIIPLGLTIANEGKATIKIDALENIPEATKIYLYDNITGIYHDIRNSDFTISLAIGEYKNRFSIQFKDKTLDVEENNLNDGLLVLYSNNYKVLIIQNKIPDATVNEVHLFNLLGQAVANWDVKNENQTRIQIPVKNLSSGVYLVKLKTSKGDYGKKIIIK
ncbi:T9SS type A sorting domain-containing protein [Flavobacterium rhamnosiphilum]|uniref:T9SS type A sorting domain-containing protein n=1 Tax=Flavobacterium rhamnosiphilum TaxID=2541724 RepID=A0A4R5FAP4_9FLAO|nr:LamG-like jellyroll fold domain-containing protein [Flavobacterium rhamnosiphilum]TDE45911.1 T9SS type A sorting domain-containing protein [Flavobacterium rhamnosiphilum]